MTKDSLTQKEIDGSSIRQGFVVAECDKDEFTVQFLAVSNGEAYVGLKVGRRIFSIGAGTLDESVAKEDRKKFWKKHADGGLVPNSDDFRISNPELRFIPK